MAERTTQKVQSRGRIQLPESWLAELGLNEGDTVILELKEGKIGVIPAVVTPREYAK